jgi:hypothetical protein
MDELLYISSSSREWQRWPSDMLSEHLFKNNRIKREFNNAAIREIDVANCNMIMKPT